ncbi:biotin/lipoyl-containing protein [Streptacidiphilus monticola]
MSVREFKMPDVGEGLTEAEILKWFVQPGDTVTDGQVVCEVETAKAAVELPIPFDGVVRELIFPEGTTVDVGTVIITVATEGAAESQPAPADGPAGDEPEPERREVLVGYGPRSGASRRRARKPGPAAPASGGSGTAPGTAAQSPAGGFAAPGGAPPWAGPAVRRVPRLVPRFRWTGDGRPGPGGRSGLRLRRARCPRRSRWAGSGRGRHDPAAPVLHSLRVRRLRRRGERGVKPWPSRPSGSWRRTSASISPP